MTDKSLPIIQTATGACGSCHSTGCSSCAPADSQKKAPTNLSRRDLARTALAGAAAAIFTSRSKAQDTGKAEASTQTPQEDSPNLNVVQKSKGPIITQVDEFFKMGPGPSSSHTMGPMRITYDYYQRISKLPEDQLKRATGLKVHLFGSLSATGA